MRRVFKIYVAVQFTLILRNFIKLFYLLVPFLMVKEEIN